MFKNVINLLFNRWTYHTEDDLDGSSHWGTLDFTYSGAGYYQVCPKLKFVNLLPSFEY